MVASVAGSVSAGDLSPSPVSCLPLHCPIKAKNAKQNNLEKKTERLLIGSYVSSCLHHHGDNNTILI